jgi:hypothetical protein
MSPAPVPAVAAVPACEEAPSSPLRISARMPPPAPVAAVAAVAVPAVVAAAVEFCI